jgi:hypothetical protein
MKRFYYLPFEMIYAWLFRQSALQQELIEAQQQIIELQKKIDKLTPKNPSDKQTYWHISSGMLSDEAANSDDIVTVRKFQKWNINFAKKYIKPYVSPKVFAECLNQMTRGLPERIGELETKKALEEKFGKEDKNPSLEIVSDKPKQLLLMQ